MFPYTASPATALTIAAMMTAEDIAAADARRVAQDFRAARRARTRRRSSARNPVTTPSGVRSMIWRWRSGRLAHTAR
jgi:hypothetical protein